MPEARRMGHGIYGGAGAVYSCVRRCGAGVGRRGTGPCNQLIFTRTVEGKAGHVCAAVFLSGYDRGDCKRLQVLREQGENTAVSDAEGASQVFGEGGLPIMTGKELLYHMSELDADLIGEAETAFSRRKAVPHVRKWLAVAACICLCLSLSVPALAAAGNESAYEMLYSIAPGVAQKLKPVQVACEDQGIEMRVVAAQVENETAQILVSMRDTAGSRLDETTDLFDSYSIHTPYDQTGSCELVDFNSDTRTVTFLLTIEQMKHVLIPGDKITFSVKELLTGKTHSEERLTQIDTANLSEITDFIENLDIRGYGSATEEAVDEKEPQLMMSDESNSMKLENGVTLSGYGLVDGKLHVQVRYADILNTDNHGDIYLKSNSGEILNCEKSISFWDESGVDSYEEYIFLVTAEEISNYEVWGEFWTGGELIEGDWQVTFPITEE